MPVGTPTPAQVSLNFVDVYNNNVTKANIGDEIYLIVSSNQAGPDHMMLTDCVATPTGLQPGSTAFPFKVIDNGYAYEYTNIYAFS